MERFSITDAAAAQKRYCNEHGIPLFAPGKGHCFHCGRNIYEPYGVRRGNDSLTLGISVEEAGRKLITGCPFCNRSFVE